MKNETHNDNSEITECLQAFNRTLGTEWALEQC